MDYFPSLFGYQDQADRTLPSLSWTFRGRSRVGANGAFWKEPWLLINSVARREPGAVPPPERVHAASFEVDQGEEAKYTHKRKGKEAKFLFELSSPCFCGAFFFFDDYFPSSFYPHHGFLWPLLSIITEPTST